MRKGRWAGSTAITGLAVSLALLTAACGNSPSSDSSAGGSGGGPGTTANAADLQKKVPVNAPGVTDTEIRVGGVASKTNPLQADYGQAAKGAQAYFDMINSQGGIYGRKLVLAADRDDQTVKNTDEVQALISQDNVFAVLPVTSLLFTGAQKLTDAKVPTFGWNINEEWANSPNLFGEKGSFICIDCALPTQPWMAKKTGATKVGLVAYGVDQSKQCADGVKKSFERWPTVPVAFTDTTVPFGSTDLSVQVSKMKDAGVDFITTCVDTNGAITLAKEMKKQGLKATQYLPNGYDYDLLKNFGDVLEGGYVGIQFVPFEVANPPKAMQDYFTWIDKVPGAKRNEISMAGWLSAAMFVDGLKLAGPEFSREKVVNGLNSLTDWNADGVTSGIDWTIEHDKQAPNSCFAMVKIENGKFVPKFGEPGKPFICIDNNAKDLPDNPPTSS